MPIDKCSQSIQHRQVFSLFLLKNFLRFLRFLREIINFCISAISLAEGIGDKKK